MTDHIHTQQDVAQLGTIMFIGAHPDDETFTAGGLLAAAAQNGQTTIIVTATRGEGGVQDESRWPAANLGDIRTAELQQALEILGCTHHYWLDYADGACATESDAPAITRITELIVKHQPDTILTFGPDGLTGHPDHQAVSAWTRIASKDTVPIYHAVEDQDIYKNYLSQADQQFNWYFNITEPPIRPARECAIAFRLTPKLRETKLQALQAMPSQYEKFFTTVPPELLENLFTIECFVEA